jgi:recombination protein RecT
MTNVAEGSSTSAELAVAAAAAGAGTRSTRKGLAELVEMNMEEIGNALPPGIMEPKRFARIVLTEFRKTPRLLLCTPESFLGALFQTAQLGLEPGGQLGHAFLIPYENSKLTRDRGELTLECQLQIGYKGFVELGGRRGIILRSREVRENDEIAFDLGSNEYLHHTWKMGTPRGDVIGFWGKVVMPDGKVTFTVMEIPEIDARKQRSSAVRSGRKTPWDTDYDAMARKTVIRAMVPQVALAPELQTALKADEAVIERSAHGDLSYIYRDAIDTTSQVGASSPSKEDVTAALNSMEQNADRIACSKYLLDNFGSIESVTDDMAPAMVKIVTEWPAVLKPAPAPAPQPTGEIFDDETEAIFVELEEPLRTAARSYLEGWRTAQAEAPSDDATALELESWLAQPADRAKPAQGPSEPEGGPGGAAAQESEPPPADPQGAAPGGVPQDVLDRVQAAIALWPLDTVKQKLREWGEPVGNAGEPVLRLRLVTKLAPEVARGNEAASVLF